MQKKTSLIWCIVERMNQNWQETSRPKQRPTWTIRDKKLFRSVKYTRRKEEEKKKEMKQNNGNKEEKKEKEKENEKKGKEKNNK